MLIFLYFKSWEDIIPVIRMSKEPSQLHNMVKQRYSAGEDIIHVE